LACGGHSRHRKGLHPVSALLPCLRRHRIQVQLALSPPGYGTDREQVLARQAPTGAYGARRTPLPVNGSGGPVGGVVVGPWRPLQPIYSPLGKIDRLALPAARDHLNLAGANHLTTIGPHFDTMAKRAAQGWLAIHCRKARAPQRRLSPGGVRSQLTVGESMPSHGFIKCAGRASDAELSRLK
jgi:hypothetical protein